MSPAAWSAPSLGARRPGIDPAFNGIEAVAG